MTNQGCWASPSSVALMPGEDEKLEEAEADDDGEEDEDEEGDDNSIS